MRCHAEDMMSKIRTRPSCDRLLTQNALVANVARLLLNPGFLPLGVTRLYTHSRSQTLVFMFQESRRTFVFSANSMFHTSTLAAPSHFVRPLSE